MTRAPQDHDLDGLASDDAPLALDKPEASVERQRGVVSGTGGHCDGMRSVARDEVLDEGARDAATLMRGIDDERGDVERCGIVARLDAGGAGELGVAIGAEKALGAGGEVGKGAREGWEVAHAEKVRFLGVGSAPDGVQAMGGDGIAQIEIADGDGGIVGALHVLSELPRV